MKGKIDYIPNGRSGHLIYQENRQNLKLYYELGGANCQAIIYIPTLSDWPSKTDIPIENRTAVLVYIAEQTIKLQVPDSYYILRDDCIEFMKS